MKHIEAKGNVKLEPQTPKGITVSGDLGYILYQHPNFSLQEIIKQMEEEEMRWDKKESFIRAVLRDYIKGEYVVLDKETGQYTMTELGKLSFMTGWW